MRRHVMFPGEGPARPGRRNWAPACAGERRRGHENGDSHAFPMFPGEGRGPARPLQLGPGLRRGTGGGGVRMVTVTFCPGSGVRRRAVA
jgi:hypothetical protein